MKKVIFTILSTSMLMFFSCEDAFLDKCFSGEANVVRREIPVDSAITRLYVMKEADVYLLYNDEQKIEVEFPENLIDDIEFKYEGGNFYITNNVTCKWRKENYAPKLYLSLPSVKRFDIIDFTSVQCIDTLKYDNITFYSLGTADFHLLVDVKNLRIQSDYIADITVQGKVENLNLWYKDLGRFYGKNLQAQNIKVDHHGENNLFLNPIKSLNANLYNVGNITSYNSPDNLVYEEFSSGRLIIEE